MATLYGIESAKRKQGIPQLMAQGVAGGGVKVAYDKYTAAGAMILNDVVKMGKLPAGARVVGYWLKSDDLGTVGALDLGWAASSDGVEAAQAQGFLGAVDVKTAAVTADHATQADKLGLGKVFASEVDIQVKVQTATDAAGSFEICVMYVID